MRSTNTVSGRRIHHHQPRPRRSNLPFAGKGVVGTRADPIAPEEYANLERGRLSLPCWREYPRGSPRGGSFCHREERRRSPSNSRAPRADHRSRTTKGTAARRTTNFTVCAVGMERAEAPEARERKARNLCRTSSRSRSWWPGSQGVVSDYGAAAPAVCGVWMSGKGKDPVVFKRVLTIKRVTIFIVPSF